MRKFPKKIKVDTGPELTLVEDRLLVRLEKKTKTETIEMELTKEGFESISAIKRKQAEKAEKPEKITKEIINDTETCSWVSLKDSKKIPSEKADNLEKRLKQKKQKVDFMAPVYRVGETKGDGGLVSPLPEVLIIKPKEDLTPQQKKKFEQTTKRLGLGENKNKSKYLSGFRYFVIKDYRKTPSYDHITKARAALKGLTEYIGIENMPLVKPVTFIPNDTFYGNQWNIPQIRCDDAWNNTRGHPSVVVAVIDTGCDLTHPDTNYLHNGVNLGTMAGTGTWVAGLHEGHGTCCAGIIGATIDNNAGTAGIAADCLILPIASQNWTDTEVAAGINYAVQEGAKVISMSFGHYAAGEGFYPIGWNFATINPAIQNAYDSGVMLVAATGNEDTNVANRYPARHNLVMAVGGSSTDDNRKTSTSPDGELWGANFANGVSVVAPCVFIPTPDIQGNNGYDNTAYFQTFNGTSSATPHVAALAALCISLNCLISNRDVQDLIEQNAAKVGTTPYATATGFPNGTRNQPMGYGRIDAFETTKEAGDLFAAQYNLLLDL